MQEEKRRWQFSLRDVLLLMFIVGLAVGWFVDHHRLVDEIERQKAQTGVDWLGNVDSTHSNNLQVWFDAATAQPAASDPPQLDPTITDPPPETPIP